MATALDHIAQKLQRAEQHIEELTREAQGFLDETPYRTLTDYGPEAAAEFDAFHLNRPVPARISVITGEVLHQLRSTLDHLVCALIVRECGTLTERSQFPILLFQPKTRDEIRRYERQIEGIRRLEVRAVIEKHQPYARGNRRRGHWLAILKSLSNTDKHRSLIVHVTHVDRILRTKELWDGLMEIEAIGPDDGANPTSGTGPEGEVIEVMEVKRQLSTRVVFDEWGDTGRVISIDEGLAGLRKGVLGVVDEMSPYLI